MIRAVLLALALPVTLLPIQAGADELTAIIQTDLQTLGYDTGGTDGEMTVQTAVAVSKFQAENGLDVTGEVSPQLAGVIKAALKNGGQAQSAATAAVGPQSAPAQDAAAMDPAAMQAVMAQMQGSAAVDPAMIQAMQAQAAQAQTAQAQAAQQACLQQKIAAAQEAQASQQRRRGFGSLMRAVSRLGGDEIAGSIASATADIAEANATISDLESAARDLGLTDEDVAACGIAQ